MAGLSTGFKKKLTITECSLDSSGDLTVGSNKFEVMLNPSSFSHNLKIKYDQKETAGQSKSDAKFSGAEPESVSFKILIDGTGVVNLPIPGIGSPPVKDQIKSLQKIVYTYDGNDHEPNHVRILWGSFIFFGRLTSMNISYKLFKPSGDPLRAEVDLKFTSFSSKNEESLLAYQRSPDMSHYIEVKAGDTLPALCYKVYKDCSYYTEVARINNLAGVQVLKPGTKLHFPPLG